MADGPEEVRHDHSEHAHEEHGHEGFCARVSVCVCMYVCMYVTCMYTYIQAYISCVRVFVYTSSASDNNVCKYI